VGVKLSSPADQAIDSLADRPKKTISPLDFGDSASKARPWIRHSSSNSVPEGLDAFDVFALRPQAANHVSMVHGLFRVCRVAPCALELISARRLDRSFVGSL